MEHLNKIIADSLQKGLILGLALILYTTLIYVSGISIFGFASIFLMILMFAAQIVYVLIMEKKFRNGIGGKISFLQLLVYGLILLVIAALLNTIFNYLLYVIIDVNYLDNQVAIFMENIEQYIQEEGQLIEMEEQMSESVSDMKNIGSSLLKSFIGPIIISPIMALIVKKDINE